LVVDDDENIRKVAKITLASVGFHVLEAGSGDEALEVETTAQDIVLLDLSMPAMDGFAVLQQMRLRGPQRPRIIVFTARPAERDRQRALHMGAVGFVSKPFDPDEMLAEVQRVGSAADASLEDRRQHELYMSRMISLLDESSRTRSPLI
jgi:CheY-like chemotaxis protein